MARSEPEYRERLSTLVSVVSIGGVVVLAITMILIGYLQNNRENITMVFTAVLPLFGAWVGTILAFYYGKENFEAASRSVTRIAEAVGPGEKLKALPVAGNMIPRKNMIVEERSPEEIKLTEILQTLSDKERLPVLNSRGAVIYMIHRSAIDRYMTQKALESSQPNLGELTLADLLKDDPALKELFEKSFGFVRESATLADAKNEMERISRCQDVFVTKSGDRSEPVIGLITNNKIQEMAKL